MSCNSLYESAAFVMPMQDDEEETTVATWNAGSAGANAAYNGSNTNEVSTTGPGKGLAKSLGISAATGWILSSEGHLPGDSEWSFFSWAYLDYASSGQTLAAGDGTVPTIQFAGTTRKPQVAGGAVSTEAVATTTWAPIFARDNNTNTSVRIGGVTTDGASLAAPDHTLWSIGSYGVSQHIEGRMAGVAMWDSALTDAEADNLGSGFEPHFSGTPTLDSSGNYDAGTTALGPAFLDGILSGDNGSVTYEHRLVSSSGTVLETVSSTANATGTFSTTPTSEGFDTYFYEARATNDGGYDVGDSPVGGSSDGWYRLASVVAEDHVLANLIHHYKLDETSGTTITDSEGSADMVADTDIRSLAITPIAPGIDGSLQLEPGERVNTSGEAPNDLQNVDALSVFFWMSTTFETTFSRQIVSVYATGGGQRCWGFWLNADEHIMVVLSDVGTTAQKIYNTTFPVNDGVVRHIGFTFANGELVVYVDGAPASVVKVTDDPCGTLFDVSFSIPLQINGRQKLDADMLDMEIGDVRMYDGALLASEVEALYEAGLEEPPVPIYQELLTDPTLFAHYTFEESDAVDEGYYDTTGQELRMRNINNSTPTPTDQSTQPAVEGVEPFAAWRTGWWKMTPGTYQKVISNDAPQTINYGRYLTVAMWAWFDPSQSFTYGTIYRSGSANTDSVAVMIRTANTNNNIDVYWRDENNAFVRQYRTTTSPLTPGGWFHLATTYNADTNATAFYINGEVATADFVTNEAELDALDPVWGFRSAGTRPDGQQRLGTDDFGLCDLFTFKRELSQAEVQSLMAGPQVAGSGLSPPLTTGLTINLSNALTGS